MKPALIATACALPAIYLAFKAGEKRAYRNALIVILLVAQGKAKVNGDGTVSMVEQDGFETGTAWEQMRENAPWQ